MTQPDYSAIRSEGYEFEQLSIKTAGEICPQCGKPAQLIKNKFFHDDAWLLKRCPACGELFKIIFKPVEVIKLRKEF